MTAKNDRIVLKRLLDLSDELGRIRFGQREVMLKHTERKELAGRARETLQKMSGVLKELDGDSPLQKLLKQHRLSRHHVLVILELLKRRLHAPDPYLKGRDLMALLFDSSYEILDGLRLIAPSSPLLTSGVIAPDLMGADDASELLELRYRLGDRAFRLFLKVLRPVKKSGGSSLDLKPRPYRSNLFYLMDLRRLALLYQKRAAQVFHFDDWDELGAGLPDSLALLNKKIPLYSRHIQDCLAKTKDADRFPLVAVTKGLKLDEEHLMILVTLIFQELLHGNPYLDAVDLLKLVCRSEQDLVRRRKLFARKSPLVANGLVVLEEIVNDKDLSAEVYVPNEVVDQVLGAVRNVHGQVEIDADSRQEFHKFLNEIDGSDDFFKRL